MINLFTLAVAETAKSVEPVLSWNLFLTAILVPTAMYILFQYIKKEMNKKAAEEVDKDSIIKKLVEQREEFKDREDNYAHTIINNSIEALHKEVITENDNSKKDRAVIFDQLKKIDVTLKLINGSVRDTKKDLEVHIAKTE